MKIPSDVMPLSKKMLAMSIVILISSIAISPVGLSEIYNQENINSAELHVLDQ
jgi:hypothetical protein